MPYYIEHSRTTSTTYDLQGNAIDFTVRSYSGPYEYLHSAIEQIRHSGENNAVIHEFEQ